MKLLSAVLFAVLVAPLAALGQNFPSKPIRIVLPNAAGGASDALARPVAQRLSEMLGQPVIVDNRPGAGGTIAATNVAKSPPDGYSLYLASIGHQVGPYLFKSVPYDPIKDFTPIVNIALIPNILVVQTSMPVHSVKEFIEYAKKNPKVPFGTYALGSPNHLAGVLLGQTMGIELEHVPYKGGAPAVTDLISGQLPSAILASSTILPHARAGKLRMLGLTENRRFDSVPGVPTIGETVPGFAVPDTWLGFLGPAGMPKSVVDFLNAETRKAINTPETKQRLQTLGFEVTGNYSADQFAAALRADAEVIRKLVTAAGIKQED
jgi:tripartite-type tricarboxylate transporter receptor subunit TctC